MECQTPLKKSHISLRSYHWSLDRLKVVGMADPAATPGRAMYLRRDGTRQVFAGPMA